MRQKKIRMFMYLRFWLKLTDTGGTLQNLKENKRFISEPVNSSQTAGPHQAEAEGLLICLDIFNVAVQQVHFILQ